MKHVDQVLGLLQKQIGNHQEVRDISVTAKEVVDRWVDPLRYYVALATRKMNPGAHLAGHGRHIRNQHPHHKAGQDRGLDPRS